MEGTGNEVLLQTDFGLVDGRRRYLAMVAPDGVPSKNADSLGIVPISTPRLFGGPMLDLA